MLRIFPNPDKKLLVLFKPKMLGNFQFSAFTLIIMPKYLKLGIKMPFIHILMPIMPKMSLFQTFFVAFLVYDQFQAWVAKQICLIFWQFSGLDPQQPIGFVTRRCNVNKPSRKKICFTNFFSFAEQKI